MEKDTSRFTIYLPKKLHRDTKVYSSKNGTTLTALIRDHLAEILDLPQHNSDMRIKCNQERRYASVCAGLALPVEVCPPRDIGGLSKLQRLDDQTLEKQKPDLFYRTPPSQTDQSRVLLDLLSSECASIIGYRGKNP